MISVLTQYTNCDIVEGMSKKRQPTDLGEQLRAEFTESGLSRFAWAKRAGVSYAIVFHLVAGDRTVTLDTASKLAAVLGLELRPVRDGGKEVTNGERIQEDVPRRNRTAPGMRQVHRRVPRRRRSLAAGAGLRLPCSLRRIGPQARKGLRTSPDARKTRRRVVGVGGRTTQQVV